LFCGGRERGGGGRGGGGGSEREGGSRVMGRAKWREKA